MQLSRVTIFILGVLFILFLFFLNRVLVYRHSEFTHGVMVLDTGHPNFSEHEDKPMILHYYVGMKEYYQRLIWDEEDAYREMRVMYNPEKPEEGEVYTVSGFWFATMLWLIAPVMIWFAFVFSFIEEDGKVEVRLRVKREGSKLQRKEEKWEESGEE